MAEIPLAMGMGSEEERMMAVWSDTSSTAQPPVLDFFRKNVTKWR